MAPQSPTDFVRQVSTWSVVWGVLLVILGMLAVASPLMAGVAASIVIAWLIVVAGIVHLTVAFHTREAGSMIWRLLVGLAYVAFGVFLIARPAAALASLTLILASLFLVEGIFDIALYFNTRAIRGSGWFLFDGVITLLLGLMIYVPWPSSSNWAIGTLVGVSLIVSGVTRVMMALAVRSATNILAKAA